MAHFAEVDENNMVLRVIVVNNDALDQEDEESSGIIFLKEIFGNKTNWVQASHSSKIRKRFPSEGYTYNTEFDAFVPPRLYESWTFDPITCAYTPPIAFPENISSYIWDEPSLSWVEV